MKKIKKLKIGKNVSLDSRKIIFGENNSISDFVEIKNNKYAIELGDNVSIGRFSILKVNYDKKKSYLKIGNNSSCGEFCFFGSAGGITIGSNVIMGQYIRFHSQNHFFDDLDILIKDQGTIEKGITIEDNCWIGSGAVILDGVHIKSGCVIGSNSLITKDVEANSVVVGNPQKVIKKR
jgi:acetyltransferase-like isoleucine patch superfamily enzyme